jgi:hypothetical protein
MGYSGPSKASIAVSKNLKKTAGWVVGVKDGFS